MEISDNFIINESTTPTAGIKFQDRQGIYLHSIKNAQVFNNSIYMKQGSNSIGIIPACSSNVAIYYNTIYIGINCAQLILLDYNSIEPQLCNIPLRNIEIVNNILYKTGEEGSNNNLVMIKFQDVDSSNCYVDFNLYYNSFSTSVNFETYHGGTRALQNFSEWKSSKGYDNNSNVTNPLFDDPSINGFAYQLTFDSPAKEAGRDVGIYEDILHRDRPFGNNVDLGAFEYSSLSKQSLALGRQDLSLQNYPNPFNPITKISFSFVDNKDMVLVQLKIFDILGRERALLINRTMAPGKHEILFDAVKYNLSSGTYVYRLTAGNQSSINKFVLLK